MSNYRKIYEKYHGQIPKDKDGRTYEIHHIDGNHKNDLLENLIAVSIQEHYDIHYAQGDWNACLRIAEKMKLSTKEISELASKGNQKRIINGTHNLLGGKLQQRISRQRVINGTHNFQKRVDGTSLQTDRVLTGTHHWLNSDHQSNLAQQRITNGTHNFIVNNPTKIKISCPYCSKTGPAPQMKQWHFDNCRYKI